MTAVEELIIVVRVVVVVIVLGSNDLEIVETASLWIFLMTCGL